MKVILTKPNYKSFFVTPPLGLGYLASHLKKENIDTVIIDGLRENLGLKDLTDRILGEKPDVVGINCLSDYYKEVIQLSKLIKQKNIPCIIGGTHPTFLPYQTLLESNADYVICGEGEIPLLKLIKNNLVNDNIPGVISRTNWENSTNIKTKAEIIKNLDDVPFPDWVQINPNKYSAAPLGFLIKNSPLAALVTSRGCPYGCTFCATPNFYDHKIRFRSPENVIEEIKYLTRTFGVKEIHFIDDNLTLDRSRILNICRLLINNNIKISWVCSNGIRADTLDEELVALMKASGCYFVGIGIESANRNILNNIKKGESLDTIINAIRLISKHGIQCQGLFIIGLPGETINTVNETINFAKKHPLTRADFGILNLFPGCKIWEDLPEDLKTKSYKDSKFNSLSLFTDLDRKYLKNIFRKAFISFYFRPRILFAAIRYLRLRQLKYIFRMLFKEYFLIT
ncbi:MAG: B12-binding domain-containing radical SAM protein [Elusimicrobia bacterium]|nr:B12-binding domain-containing radical SAM protein [Candidatus Liberimonas magnetica]